MIHRAVPLLFAAAVLAGGCASTQTRSAGPDYQSIAEQQARARQLVAQAGQTAARANEARRKDNTETADKLSRQAVEQYREALLLSSEMPDAWNNMGVQLMEMGDYLAASEAFTFAIQQSPTDPRPCENMGIVYDRTGWPQEAIKYFDMALERSPNYLPALRGAIKCAHQLGEANEVRLAQVRRALMIETEPGNREFFEREVLRISGRLDQTRQRR